ncbi:hypothetical protein DP033_19650 [Escherichia coli]|nr:hypothetical protein [Escherichia coli]EFO2100727.1 hypothetical protein [Escherichia coli]
MGQIGFDAAFSPHPNPLPRGARGPIALNFEACNWFVKWIRRLRRIWYTACKRNGMQKWII